MSARPPTETERLGLFIIGAVLGRLACAALEALDRLRPRPTTPQVDPADAHWRDRYGAAQPHLN